MGIGRLMDFLNETFTPPSEVFLKNVLCIVSKVVHETGMPIAALTVMWIALERLLATILIKSYEKKTSTIGMRITITVVSSVVWFDEQLGLIFCQFTRSRVAN